MFVKYIKKFSQKKAILLFILLLLTIIIVKNVANNKNYTIKLNIDNNNTFFKLEEVIEQIKSKKLIDIKTIYGICKNVGNALIVLNNIINLCKEIGCKYILSPFGLRTIIKNPIPLKKYNLTIIPYSLKEIIKIDIQLSWENSFRFIYKNSYKNRLNIIRKEILYNIPKYDANPNDLYIHIRSGDIFLNSISKYYSQPPLCFYKKIINENKFNKTYILSNGNENPVIDKLLHFYPNIKFIHGLLENDISIIINAYNFVMSASTFSMTLIGFNYNLKNLFIYKIYNYGFWLNHLNCTILNMEPSQKYKQMMYKNWKNTNEQLELMISEKCENNQFNQFIKKNKIFLSKLD